VSVLNRLFSLSLGRESTPWMRSSVHFDQMWKYERGVYRWSAAYDSDITFRAINGQR